MGNCEVTHQTIWPILKPQRDGPKALVTIHGPLGLNCQPLEKATTIVNCLENKFTPHDLCDKNHKRWVQATVQELLDAADDTPLEKERSFDMQELIKPLKLRKAYRIDCIPKECLRHLP
jgi:hypothetical protein